MSTAAESPREGSTPARGSSNPESPRAVRRRQEDWLRRSGLPLVLAPRVRSRNLLARTTPLLATAALLLTALALILRADALVRDVSLEHLTLGHPSMIALVAAVVLAVLAPLVGLVLPRILRRAGAGLRWLIGLVVIAICLALPATLTPSGQKLMGWANSLLVVAVVWGLAYLGFGSILGWLTRRGLATVGSIGPMVTRALPVLVMATIFFFFNAEMWQVAANISLPRALLIATLLLMLAVVVVWVAMQDEVRMMREEHAAQDVASLSARAGRLLTGTPFEAAGAPSTTVLRRAERLNIVMVPVLAQTVQIVLFTTLITGFFVAFGVLTITDQTAKAWIGREPEQFTGVLAVLPGSWALVKVAIVLGAFAGLSFAASSAADAAHRAIFVRPILADLERGLAARDSYVHLYGRA